MFGPNDNLSRARLAQILYNKEGNGYGDGRLNPGGLATHAQVAQMLMNFLNNG